MSYVVAQRTREMGVRLALGATRREVTALVVRDSARLVGAGIAVGVGLALAAGPLIGSQLFQTSPRDPSSIAVAALVLGGVTIVALAAVWLKFHLSCRGAPLAPPLDAYLKVGLIADALPYLTVAVAAHAIDARTRVYERDLEAERVRSQLAESRLEALTAQLQPHFLFNTLQGISTLITHDPAAADAMLSDLSDLLREVLRGSERREVTVDEELRVLESYLSISRRRFGDRLTVKVARNADVGRALVPFFVLQPLVENALHHGVGSHAGPANVTVAARREKDRLVLTVEDDGPGVNAADSGRGIGLANTRERLSGLYGEAQRLELGRTTDGGFAVRVELPFHEAEIR